MIQYQETTTMYKIWTTGDVIAKMTSFIEKYGRDDTMMMSSTQNQFF